VITIPIWLDLAAIVFGALAGALAGRREDFDVAGVLFLAVVGGVGGGVLRDVVLGAGPPVALVEPLLLPGALVSGLVVYYLGHLLDERPALARRTDAGFVWLDAGSLAVYGIIGTAKADHLGLPPVSCVAVGVLAATGGTILRDVIVNERPTIFLPGTLYALAAAVGATAFIVAYELTSRPYAAAVGGGALIVGLRLASYLRGWSTAPPRRHDQDRGRDHDHVTGD
jgi:uncharacterized membrane protein YeiH